MMSARKMFVVVFLAILAAAAVIGLFVGTYNSEKRAREVHREIQEMYVRSESDALYRKLLAAQSIEERDKIISDLVALYPEKERGKMRENAQQSWQIERDYQEKRR
jgi:hypothetical protein